MERCFLFSIILIEHFIQIRNWITNVFKPFLLLTGVSEKNSTEAILKKYSLESNLKRLFGEFRNPGSVPK